MNGKWKLVYDTSDNCDGCWDSRCIHTICPICGGHGHTAEEHPKPNRAKQAEWCIALANKLGPTCFALKDRVERIQEFAQQNVYPQ